MVVWLLTNVLMVKGWRSNEWFQRVLTMTITTDLTQTMALALMLVPCALAAIHE